MRWKRTFYVHHASRSFLAQKFLGRPKSQRQQLMTEFGAPSNKNQGSLGAPVPKNTDGFPNAKKLIGDAGSVKRLK